MVGVLGSLLLEAIPVGLVAALITHTLIRIKERFRGPKTAHRSTDRTRD